MDIKLQEARQIVNQILKNSEEIKGANVEILDLKRDILVDIGIKNDKIDQRLKKLEADQIGGPGDKNEIHSNNPLIKRLNMKVNYDEFENQLAKKVEKNDVQGFSGAIAQIQKQ